MNITWIGRPHATSLDDDQGMLVDRRQLVLSALGMLAVGATGAKALEEASDVAILPYPVPHIEMTRLRSASNNATAGAFLEASLHVMMQ